MENNEQINLQKLNSLNKGTMMEQLGIEYTEARDGFIKAKMPINEKTFQPMKILHGGASLALAETIAGLGSSLMVDMKLFNVRGAQISANHIGSASSGNAFGTAQLIHKGKNTHLWNIEITDENERPLSTIRITNFIIKK